MQTSAPKMTKEDFEIACIEARAKYDYRECRRHWYPNRRCWNIFPDGGGDPDDSVTVYAELEHLGPETSWGTEGEWHFRVNAPKGAAYPAEVYLAIMREEAISPDKPWRAMKEALKRPAGEAHDLELTFSP